MFSSDIPTTTTRLTGFGRTAPSVAQVLSTADPEVIAKAVAQVADAGGRGVIARGLGRLGLTWSCNAKANVDRETLRVMRDNGLRLLLVGYESGNQQILINIKKGLRVERARRFAATGRPVAIASRTELGTPSWS